ncbi:MAG: 16S rRNA (guanine(527)-N(7))-methyltransferase RsmG [Alphaproteobacteria bacterium]
MGSGINTFSQLNNVSRETLNMLLNYEKKIIEFNKKMNLISSSTEKNIWVRHFCDSAKIFKEIQGLHSIENDKLSICDVGTGAGLPGIVLAIMAKGAGCGFNFTLIDSNKKKCLFVEKIIQLFGLNCKIVNNRVENLSMKYDVIISRAYASLSKLLKTTYHLSSDKSTYILPRGKSWEKDLNIIKKKWKYEVNIVKNNKRIDESGGVTLILEKVCKK